jgi:hypothetical protein
MFSTTCPICKAEGELTVVGGDFHAVDMPLSPDGFSFCDAKQVNTDKETVCCQACGRFFELGDLHLDDDPPPDPRIKLKE